jgi:RNA polymerase sigma-70 factor, ECF subfamily
MIDSAVRDSWHVLGQRLGAYIGRRLPAQEVDDVLQDVLLRIHKNIRYLSDDSRFGPWVYSVARNAVIDRLRKQQPVTGNVDVESVAASTEEDDEQALLGCVTPFVARLPEAYRHAITLVELQGLSQADAAAIEGISVSGMKSRVQRARRMLREMFEECCSLTIDARGRVIEAKRRVADAIVIEKARPEDAADIRALLETHHLPTADLESHLHTAVVARRAGMIVGSAALEIYREGALLRSVAVAPDLKGHGVGQRLTEAMIELGKSLGSPSLYLLTTTAQTYFPSFGFQEIDRTIVPDSVQASVEFTSACPSTAIIMRKRL